jgi:hypothetical protein
MYRIAHWKLMERLKELPQAPDGADCGFVGGAERREVPIPVRVADRGVTMRAGLSEQDHADPVGARRE